MIDFAKTGVESSDSFRPLSSKPTLIEGRHLPKAYIYNIRLRFLNELAVPVAVVSEFFANMDCTHPLGLVVLPSWTSTPLSVEQIISLITNGLKGSNR